MAVYENYEKYDMLVCVIQSNENLQEASELYLQRYRILSAIWLG